ncbi:MAG: zinc ribbon domain-containing protein [Firmicutes bacterium]|nr:zinc ribbon domain-containing protein [Bacillota bacterium]
MLLDPKILWYSSSLLICPNCGAGCSIQADTCQRCGISTKNITKCGLCGHVFFYTGENCCPDCGEQLPDYSKNYDFIDWKESVGYQIAVSNTPHTDTEITADTPAYNENNENADNIANEADTAQNVNSDNGANEADTAQNANNGGMSPIEEFIQQAREMGYQGIRYYISGSIAAFTYNNDLGIMQSRGNALSDTRTAASRKSFNIPDNADVYFIVSAQVFGGFANDGKGFAITSRGIYYRDDRGIGHIDWATFSNCDIAHDDLSHIHIHNMSLKAIQVSDTETVANCLSLLQICVNVFLDEVIQEEAPLKLQEQKEAEEAAAKREQEEADEKAKGYMGIAHIIQYELRKYNFTDMSFYHAGGQVINGKKVDAARTAFSIPPDLDVYFIASAQMLGGFKNSGKGFAITKDGIYYHDSNAVGKIDWQSFADCNIVHDSSKIFVGCMSMYIIQCNDLSAFVEFLRGIQKWVALYIDEITGNKNVAAVPITEADKGPEAITDSSVNGEIQSEPPHTAAENVVICPNCGTENLQNARFCKGCGNNIAIQAPDKPDEEVFCINCGAKVKAGKKFCPGCGEKIYY